MNPGKYYKNMIKRCSAALAEHSINATTRTVAELTRAPKELERVPPGMLWVAQDCLPLKMATELIMSVYRAFS
jgi:hypothetical protein